MLISCLPQCHLQVGALHMKKQVGAIRRKIAKPGPGLRLCVQGIPRIFHGSALFLAVQCTKEGQTNLQKVPSHGVFLPEDMEETGETVFDSESIFLRILMVGQQRHLQLAPIFSVRRKVSPARFTAYVNPGTNVAIPTRGRSKWMVRTKTTAIEAQEYENDI